MTEEEETAVRATVKPEIIIGGIEGGLLFPPPDPDSEKLIRILDRRSSWPDTSDPDTG